MSAQIISFAAFRARRQLAALGVALAAPSDRPDLALASRERVRRQTLLQRALCLHELAKLP
jgi:hypothetical protein